METVLVCDGIEHLAAIHFPAIVAGNARMIAPTGAARLRGIAAGSLLPGTGHDAAVTLHQLVERRSACCILRRLFAADLISELKSVAPLDVHPSTGGAKTQFQELETVMVLKLTIDGLPYREPPYTPEEEAELCERACRPPVAYVNRFRDAPAGNSKKRKALPPPEDQRAPKAIGGPDSPQFEHLRF